jgi:hypothetical protein
LQHPHEEYLASEQEKLDFFTGRLGLEQAVLPVNRYPGRASRLGKSEAVTERFFVEKFPLFLSPLSERSAPPVVSFCFVDEGEATLSGFWTFLQRYHLLFAHLRECHVIYVAANAVHFKAAERAFERFVQQVLGFENGATGDPVSQRLLDHFEARRLYEAQAWTAFDRAKLIRYRDERQEFSGEKFDALYRQWKQAGPAAVKAAFAARTEITNIGHWAFSTYELKENYDLFGQITTY